jgi:iron only hydrogenase large subunit-like protein
LTSITTCCPGVLSYKRKSKPLYTVSHTEIPIAPQPIART